MFGAGASRGGCIDCRSKSASRKPTGTKDPLENHNQHFVDRTWAGSCPDVAPHPFICAQGSAHHSGPLGAVAAEASGAGTAAEDMRWISRTPPANFAPMLVSKSNKTEIQQSACKQHRIITRVCYLRVSLLARMPGHARFHLMLLVLSEIMA